ncbi:hydratase [Naumannella sp. ID2617S]|nr:hydratase [Naumannella sp. ID2617S]
MDAVQLLRAAVRDESPVERLLEGSVPDSRVGAYARQRAWADGAPVAGWKIAATSIAGQRHLRVDGPLAGCLTEAMLLEPGEPVSLAGNRMRLAELEFAFRLIQDLPPREGDYSLEEVLTGTGDLLLSWEIPSTRFADPATVGAVPLILDNACAHQLALAPAADQGWREADLPGTEVRATNSNGTVHQGRGGNAMGDPRVALTWLVNELSAAGIGVQAGQFVTTGVCIDPMPVAPGESITGEWGRFGSFGLRFTE